MVLHKESSHTQCKWEDSDHSDVLYVRCKVHSIEIVIVLVYMSTNDKTLNRCIQQKVENIIRKEEQGSLLLLGDFNGHLGFLGPQQCDENGKMVLSWTDEWNFVLLNADPNCFGETTWSRGQQISTIDFMLVNQKLNERFLLMIIDEDKTKFDLSDHHLIEAQFQVPFRRKEKKRMENVSYYKISETRTEDFNTKLEAHLRENPTKDIRDLNSGMKNNANAVVKRTFKKSTDDGEKLASPLWFTSSIKREISRRRELNKKARRATEENKHSFREAYHLQKLHVQLLVKSAIKEHEEKISKENMSDKNRSKRV